MRRRQGREYWQTTIQRFEGGHLSHEAFCSRYRLNIGTFRTWLYRLRSENAATPKKKPAKFVEVVAAPPTAKNVARCRLRFGELEFEFEEMPKANYLSDLACGLRAETK